ncbi:hypothetical protein PR003_g20571 [Phytophthora rubi]|uniref:Uncharacterized protein n=1 Tax=Phytophthora rubi TaxID=129364 RepID=A0A6A4DN16_9STRA|nr:hypothetical protein PR001_g19833 [Phytophthora rubi]KAE9309165.1 hypothetical protein PR003_g20571 [Phytophthora rubi]
MLRSVDHKVFSHFRLGANFPGRLTNVLEQLPQTVDGATLARVKIFTALDDSLGLDIFRFDQQKPFLNQTEDEKLAHASIQRFCAEIQASKYAGDKSYPAGFAAVNDVWLLGGDLDDTSVAALTLKYWCGFCGDIGVGING